MALSDYVTHEEFEDLVEVVERNKEKFDFVLQDLGNEIKKFTGLVKEVNAEVYKLTGILESHSAMINNLFSVANTEQIRKLREETKVSREKDYKLKLKDVILAAMGVGLTALSTIIILRGIL